MRAFTYQAAPTRVVFGAGSLQSLPQSMPAPLTVPAPLRTTLTTWVMGVKVAVTVVSAPMVKVQLPVPVQPPAAPRIRRADLTRTLNLMLLKHA